MKMVQLAQRVQRVVGVEARRTRAKQNKGFLQWNKSWKALSTRIDGGSNAEHCSVWHFDELHVLYLYDAISMCSYSRLKKARVTKSRKTSAVLLS